MQAQALGPAQKTGLGMLEPTDNNDDWRWGRWTMRMLKAGTGNEPPQAKKQPFVEPPGAVFDFSTKR